MEVQNPSNLVSQIQQIQEVRKQPTFGLLPQKRTADDLEREKEELILSIKKMKQEILELEEEKTNLEEEKQHTSKTNKKADKQIGKYLIQVSNEDFIESIQKKKNEPLSDEQLLSKIRSLAGFSEITFHKANNFLLPSNDSSEINTRRYMLKGKSQNLPFRISFDVNERNLEVISLKIEVRPDMKVELQPLIEKAQEEKSLRMFFNGFIFYAHNVKMRSELFEELIQIHGDKINIPFGKLSNILFFAPKQQPNFSFELIWDIMFLQDGRATRSIEVVPTFSEELVKQDKSNLTNILAVQFKNIAEMKGLRNAIDTIIKLCILETSD